MTAGPGQGVIEACLDPGTPEARTCRIVDLSTLRKTPRMVVTHFRDLAPGAHVLEVTVREGPVELDGVLVVQPVPEEPAAPAPSGAPSSSPAPAG
jgi:hypothetical protein